jgi:hypothetical protein
MSRVIPQGKSGGASRALGDPHCVRQSVAAVYRPAVSVSACECSIGTAQPRLLSPLPAAAARVPHQVAHGNQALRNLGDATGAAVIAVPGLTPNLFRRRLPAFPAGPYRGSNDNPVATADDCRRTK